MKLAGERVISDLHILPVSHLPGGSTCSALHDGIVDGFQNACARLQARLPPLRTVGMSYAACLSPYAIQFLAVCTHYCGDVVRMEFRASRRHWNWQKRLWNWLEWKASYPDFNGDFPLSSCALHHGFLSFRSIGCVPLFSNTHTLSLVLYFLTSVGTFPWRHIHLTHETYLDKDVF